MLLSHSKKFVFFHIPKTGGTSVRSMLLPHADITPHHYYKNCSKGCDPLNINQDVAKKLFDLPEDYIEFVIVREPIDRLISLFKYGNNKSKFGTFSNFCQRMAYHYRYNVLSNFYDSQLIWTKNSLTNNLNILKFENLHETHISELLGINELKLPHLNKSQEILEITDKERQFCLDFLAEEYEVLGY